MENNKHIECTKHIVAFLDILGSSNRIKESDEAMLNSVYNLYYDTLDWCSKDESGINQGKIKIKIFSDNILLAYEIPTYNKGKQYDYMSAIIVMNQFVGVFQLNALKRNMLIRGGITIGDLFFDDVFVWGEALLRAYELESQMAFFPRVLIDFNVVEKINEADFRGGNKFEICNVNQDTDLLFYIDYFSHFKEEQEWLNKTIVNAYNSICLESISSNEKADKIYQKCAWQVCYMNKYLSFDLFDSSDKKINTYDNEEKAHNNGI